MTLSKPLYNLLGLYFQELFNHPVRTKALTCCVIASSGNLASQYISGYKVVNLDSLFAYGIYGLIFGGTIPHYFYNWLERLIPEETPYSVAKTLLIERLLYCPLYQAFTLYMIARFEGKDHKTAIQQLEAIYWPVLSASWKYLTILQLINLTYVPPMLRVLITNLIGFFWTIYIANKRRQQQLHK